MNLGDGVHLTYCSNIHPGESWAEVRANLAAHVAAVHGRVAPGQPFGIGLRLSARAADELADAAALAEFKDFLAWSRMYVYTINGFPHGRFHGTPVKQDVYQPDWRDAERLRYTNRLADLLAELLPDGVDGSISTVPGAYRAALAGRGDVDAMVEHLLRHIAHLVALRARSGRLIALALEPEPDCWLETVAEVVECFGSELHGAAAARRLAELAGIGVDAAAHALREHLGLCLDLCHAAVEYEDAAACIARLRDAGVAVFKVQISAGLRLPTLDDAALTALARFDDPVYLHQVVERGPEGAKRLKRYPDLPQARAALAGAPAAEREWRVHFHVPIFLDRIEPFASTQDFVREVLAMQRRQPISRHLEVETYTWDVLPEPWRSGSVDEAIARELAWVRAELAA
ncbi:MAG: metabolite traffic protein EboE [Burkholderiales bacterium]|nr:metabolite traffic protein EboE [Burkholderiales bacterium]